MIHINTETKPLRNQVEFSTSQNDRARIGMEEVLAHSLHYLQPHILLSLPTSRAILLITFAPSFLFPVI